MESFYPEIGGIQNEIESFLIDKSATYENPNFLEEDPVSIPHQFSRKEDIEISGFLVALIAWGQRKSIQLSGQRMMDLMSWDPYRFVMDSSPRELEPLSGFVHRTFNGEDLCQCICSLRRLYADKGGLEGFFTANQGKRDLQDTIGRFKSEFFQPGDTERTHKHIADPSRGSAAKRINMFLRWMVRSPERGVDFGLWKGISPSKLSCPLDVHSGRVARKLGLLVRKQNDSRAVQELDASLRAIDAADPVRFDFALFGLGVFEKF